MASKGGLALLIGAAKAKPKDGAEEPDGDEGAGGDDFLDVAFDAVKEGNRGAFRRAMSSYVKSCMKG